MKAILSLFLLFVAHICFAQDTTYLNVKLQPSTKSNYQYYEIRKPDAVTMAPEQVVKVTRYYRNSVKQMTGYVLANDTAKRVGLYTYFEERGRMKSIYLYDYKRSIKYFLNTYNYFKKIEACDADVDLGISLYLDGHMKRSGFYLSDRSSATRISRKMCTWQRYNPFTENIIEVTDYNHGVMDGRHFHYHGNGKLWREEYYKDGKKTGVWKKYWYDGSLRKKITIKSNK